VTLSLPQRAGLVPIRIVEAVSSGKEEK